MKRARRWRWWIAPSLLAALLVAAWWMTTQPIGRVEPGRGALAVDERRLEAHARMLSETLGPRDYSHARNLDRVARYVAGELRAAGGAVSEQPFAVGDETYRNVIAAFGPETRARVIVGAHYDACGPEPGADDDASGVAGLIELARLLAPSPPPMRVELVAFTLEEPPYFRTESMGSRVHARSLRAAGADVRAMLSLEMIGYFSDERGTQSFPTALLAPFYPSEGNFIAVIGDLGSGALVRTVKRAMRGATPLAVYSLDGPRSIPGVDASDHASYWAEGWPAALITDTAWYRNRAYHTADDRAARLDYHRLAMVVQATRAAVDALTR